MKKICFFLSLLMISAISFGQFPTNIPAVGSAKQQTYAPGAFGSDSGYVYRTSFTDTVTANKGFLKGVAGITIRVGDTLFMRNQAKTQWLKIGVQNSDLLFTTAYSKLYNNFSSLATFSSTNVNGYYDSLGTGISKAYDNGLVLSGNTTRAFVYSNITQRVYGDIGSQNFTHELIFQVLPSIYPLEIGIGMKSDMDYSAAINWTWANKLYSDGGSSNYINNPGSMAGSSSNITTNIVAPKPYEYVKLTFETYQDSSFLVYENLKTHATYKAIRRTNTTVADFGVGHSWYSVFFKSGAVKLIASNVTNKESGRIYVLGTSIFDGYFLPKISGITNQLQKYVSSPVINMAKAASISANYYGYKEIFNVRNSIFILPGIAFNDTVQGLNRFQSRANIQYIAARARANNNVLIFTDNSRVSTTISGYDIARHAIDSMMHIDFGATDTIVTFPQYISGWAPDGVHPGQTYADYIVSRIIDTAFMYFTGADPPGWKQKGNSKLPRSAIFGTIDDSASVRIRTNNIWWGIFDGTHFGNLALGKQALQQTQIAHPVDNIAGKNVALGEGAMFSNTGGYWNVGVGFNPLHNNTTGYQNTAIGGAAMYYNQTGINNVAIGMFTDFNNTAGNYNNALGWHAMENAYGNDNTVMGRQALSGGYNTSVNSWNFGGNSAFGSGALYQGAVKSVGLGAQSFSAITNPELLGFRPATLNIGVGYYAMFDVMGGRSVIGIGDSTYGANNLTNSVAIGSKAYIGISNAMSLLDTARSPKVGIGTGFPSQTLDVATGLIRMRQGGTAGYVLTSDANGVGTWQAPSGGGGGGGGTVNSGTINRLAYYAATGTTVSNLSAITANRLLISDANGLPTHSSVTNTEAGYLSGVTSAIQTQLSAKAPLASPTFTGNPAAPTVTAGDSSTALATTAFVKRLSATSLVTTVAQWPLRYKSGNYWSGIPDTLVLSQGFKDSASLWDIVSGGINYSGGNVGIGNNAPQGQLHISTGSDDHLIVNNSGVYGFGDLNGHVNLIGLTMNANTNTFSLSSNGDDGVDYNGTTELTVHTSGTDQALKLNKLTHTAILSTGNDELYIQNDETNEMRLMQSGGNVGIGVTNPTEKLDLGATGTIRIRSGGADGYVFTSDANGVGTWKAPGGFSQYVQSFRNRGSGMLGTVDAGPERVNNNTSAMNMVNGVVQYEAITIGAGTVAGVGWAQFQTGNYTASGYNGVGLYTFNSAGTFTKVAESTNDGNIWKGAPGYQYKAFSTPYVATAGTYYVAFTYNNSAEVVVPQIRGYQPYVPTNTQVLDATNSKASLLYGSGTSLPSTATASGLTINGDTGSYWMFLKE